MKTIDAHTHAWGARTDELPWTSNVLPPEWSGPYTAHDLIDDLNHAHIDEAVVVSTPLYGRGRRANEYTMRAIEAYPSRLWGVGIMDLFADDADERLRRVVGHDRMLGVRMHACLEYDTVPTELNRDATWILDDELTPVWEAAADLGTTVFIFPKAQQLDAVEDLADAYPDVTLVVDHMAFPDDTTAPDEEPWTRFRLLAEHENVYVKISSLPRSSDERFPYPDLHGYVRALLNWFGADRLMLGSDYPWMDSWASYEDCISWPEQVDFLSARDLAHLSYRTFEEVHG